MLLAIHCGMMLVFLLLGLVFSQGKGAFLIAGYNTAPKREKEKYDETALCRFMGKLMFALAGTWVPIALSALLDRMWLLWMGLGLSLAVCIGGVVYMNTGHRFEKKKK